MRFSTKPLVDTRILEMSSGEVTSVGLFDTRRDRPVLRGLLCEQIFGPMKDYECSCNQLRGSENAGKVCNTCKVICGPSSLRGTRYGHIDLVVHTTNPMTRDLLVKFLGIKQKELLQVLYGKRSIRLVKADEREMDVRQGDKVQDTCVNKSGEFVNFVTFPRPTEDEDLMEIDSGSEALYRLVNLLDTQKTLMMRTDRSSMLYLQKKDFEIQHLLNRYWQVPPADIRPITISAQNQLDSAFNELYRRLLRHSMQVKFAIDNAPAHKSINCLIVNHSILIQKSVDGLVKDGATYKKFGANGSQQRIESVFDRLKDKDGRIRGSVLGKRVDFSGRSSITTAPDLQIDQVGIPEKMAIELMRPFIIQELVEEELVMYRTAQRWWKTRHRRAYDAMERILAREDAPLVLLNRAPSLHRYSVLALRMKTHPGKSLRLAPALCAPFNADHDGDTMAVHMILSAEANAEARELLMPQASILGSRNGSPTFSLSHEQVVGVYYLSYIPEGMEQCKPKAYRTQKDALEDFELRKANGYELKIQTPVYLVQEKVQSTFGRLLIEEAVQVPAGYLKSALDKNSVSGLIKFINAQESDKSQVLRKIEKLIKLGNEYSTMMGLSIAADHLQAPSTRDEIIRLGNEFEDADTSPNKERSIRNWAKLTSQLEKDYLREQDDDNPIKFMYQTKARVSLTQIRQMAIWKGQIADPSGGVVMIKSSLKDGIGPWPYLLSCKGTRQSLGANHEVVPQSGYFCRQLVSACRDLYVQIPMGGTRGEHGIELDAKDAIGRYEYSTGNFITEEYVKKTGQASFEVMSPVTGVGPITQMECGNNPATNTLHRVGTPVGVIAAQSKAEPSTQLALRSKHLSGAISIADDTLNKIVAIESGRIADVEKTLDLVRIKVIPDESDKMQEYVFHHNHEELVGTYKELPRHSFNLREFNVGDRVEEGEPLVVYSESVQGADISGTLAQVIRLVGAANPGKSFNYPRSIISPFEGELALENRLVTDNEGFSYEVVDLKVAGQYVSTLKKKCAILVPHGARVTRGQQLTHGLPDLMAVWEDSGRDMKLLWTVFYKAIKDLFGTSGVTIAPIHYEILLRAMTDLHTVQDDCGEKLEVRERMDSMAGVELHNVNMVPQKYPSMFRSIGYGYILSRIKKAVANLETTYGTPTERVMFGGLIPSPRA